MMAKRYRPSNGTEGDNFMAHFCAHCKHDINDDCDIAARVMAFNVDDTEYPNEWRYSTEGNPECAAYTPNPDDTSLLDHKARYGEPNPDQMEIV